MARRKKVSSVATWEGLQENSGRSVRRQPVARRMRRWIRTFFLLLILFVLLGSAGFLGYQYHQETGWFAVREPGDPITLRVVLETNGVLDRDWVFDTANLPRETLLSSLSPHRIYQQLSQDPQVAEVVLVAVRAPDTLEVRLREHQPMARIHARDREGNPEMLLVTRDGVLLPGIRRKVLPGGQEELINYYPLRYLRDLPRLNGVRLVRDRATGRYRDLPGMERIHDLITTTRREFPELLEQWAAIDLGDYRPDREPFPGIIRVVSTHAGEIIFAPSRFSSQLRSLYFTQNQVPPGTYQRIDLTSANEAVVQRANQSVHGQQNYRRN